MYEKKFTVSHIIRKLEKFDDLPTLPVIVDKLLTTINDPKSSFKELAEILEKDQPMSAKILRIANSAYYSRGEKIGSLKRASIVLGFKMINSIVVAIGIMDSVKIDKSCSPHFTIEGFWKHSIAVAVIARELGKQFGFPDADKLYYCGLLHDIGIILTLMIVPNYFESLLDEIDTTGKTLIEIELERGGFCHTHVGKWICKKWKLPTWIIDTAEMHHTPVFDSSILYSNYNIKAINIVYFADIIAHLKKLGKAGHSSPPDTADPIIWNSLDKSRLDLKKLNKAIEDAQRAFEVFFPA